MVGDRHFNGQALGLRTRGEGVGQGLGHPTWSEHGLLQLELADFRLRRIDHQSGQRGQVFGAGLDAESPAALALAEIGRCQQLAMRQNAGQRGPDVVSERRERGLVHAKGVAARPPG